MVVTLALAMCAAEAGHVMRYEVGPAAPIPTLTRLVRMHDAGTPGEPIAAGPNRARLQALVQFVRRADERMKGGGYHPAELFNTLQAERDMVQAGANASAHPEEALCWHRAGLDLATARLHFLARKPEFADSDHPAIDQARAQVELLRRMYDEAKARCAAR